jgi:hypothetical protein
LNLPRVYLRQQGLQGGSHFILALPDAEQVSFFRLKNVHLERPQTIAPQVPEFPRRINPVGKNPLQQVIVPQVGGIVFLQPEFVPCAPVSQLSVPDLILTPRLVV